MFYFGNNERDLAKYCNKKFKKKRKRKPQKKYKRFLNFLIRFGFIYIEREIHIPSSNYQVPPIDNVSPKFLIGIMLSLKIIKILLMSPPPSL